MATAGIKTPFDFLMGVDDVDYEKAVALFYEDLHRFALSLADNPHDARDLTQESYGWLLTKRGRIRDRSKVKSWRFTTLYRAFLGRKRFEESIPHDQLSTIESEVAALASDVLNKMDGSGLADTGISACKIFEWQQSRVTLLCFKFAGRDVDVFVVNASDLPRFSLGRAPAFFTQGGVTTAAWRRDQKVYLVASAMPQAELQSPAIAAAPTAKTMTLHDKTLPVLFTKVRRIARRVGRSVRRHPR